MCAPRPTGHHEEVAAASLDEQIVRYLTDVHAIEVQAIAQLRVAPGIAGGDDLAAPYAEHLEQSLEHERLVREHLALRGATPSASKDVAGRLSGWGMVQFARVSADSPGKLAAQAYSYEHMEIAAYDLLGRIAERVGDPRLQRLAERIGDDERAMADRIAAGFDRAVDASLDSKGAEDVSSEVITYLRDAHALESQSLQMLETGPLLVDLDPLNEAFRDHLAETHGHQDAVDARLAELGSRPARFRAAALRISALSLGTFFKVQPDTPAKLAGFAYAFEALEAAAYELLLRTAQRAGDEQTASVASTILANERAHAERVVGTWDAAVTAALDAHPLPA